MSTYNFNLIPKNYSFKQPINSTKTQCRKENTTYSGALNHMWVSPCRAVFVHTKGGNSLQCFQDVEEQRSFQGNRVCWRRRRKEVVQGGVRIRKRGWASSQKQHPSEVSITHWQQTALHPEAMHYWFIPPCSLFIPHPSPSLPRTLSLLYRLSLPFPLCALSRCLSLAVLLSLPLKYTQKSSFLPRHFFFYLLSLETSAVIILP